VCREPGLDLEQQVASLDESRLDRDSYTHRKCIRNSRFP
jgi:hypothetical protein